eukprot:scaffold286661_cov26-Tisochrysis_lutea.AAC.8
MLSSRPSPTLEQARPRSWSRVLAVRKTERALRLPPDTATKAPRLCAASSRLTCRYSLACMAMASWSYSPLSIKSPGVVWKNLAKAHPPRDASFSWSITMRIPIARAARTSAASACPRSPCHVSVLR